MTVGFRRLPVGELELHGDQPSEHPAPVIGNLVGALDRLEGAVLQAGVAHRLHIDVRVLPRVAEHLGAVVEDVLEVVQEVGPFQDALADAPFHGLVEGKAEGVVPVDDAEVLVEHVHRRLGIGRGPHQQVGRAAGRQDVVLGRVRAGQVPVIVLAQELLQLLLPLGALALLQLALRQGGGRELRLEPLAELHLRQTVATEHHGQDQGQGGPESEREGDQGDRMVCLEKVLVDCQGIERRYAEAQNRTGHARLHAASLHPRFAHRHGYTSNSMTNDGTGISP